MNIPAFLLVTAVQVAYLVLGGYLFQYLEKPVYSPNDPPDYVFEHDLPENYHSNETHLHAIFHKFSQNLLETNLALNISIDATNSTNSRSAILTAKIKVIPPPSWEIYEAIFYAETLVTTIGYGQTSPKTLLGRQISVLYSVFGVPLLFLWAATVGEGMLKVARKLLCCRKPVTKKERKRSAIIEAVIVTGSGCIGYLLLPSILWYYMEETWSFADSFYYSFIGLSTIGLGDLVAANEPDSPDWYRLVHNIWMMTGMAWISSVIGLLVKVFRIHAKKTEARARMAGNQMKKLTVSRFRQASSVAATDDEEATNRQRNLESVDEIRESEFNDGEFITISPAKRCHGDGEEPKTDESTPFQFKPTTRGRPTTKTDAIFRTKSRSVD